MTLAELEALEGRRRIAIRHQRFNAALIAATVINTNRPVDADSVSPFDFLPGFETTPEEAEKAKVRKSVKLAIKMDLASRSGWTTEELAATKAKLIARMREDGTEDPEGIMREVEQEAGL